MTLSTDIYILDPIEPEAVLRRVREIMAELVADCPPVEEHQIEDRESYFRADYLADSDDDTPRILQTLPGQGLPAWVMVEYRPGRPLRTEDEAVRERRREHDRDHAGGYCTVCPEGDGGHAPDDTALADHFGGHLRRCYLRIDMDTAYGYRDDAGRGCGDLHADIIRRLAPWLADRDVRFEWKHESSGVVYWCTAGLETLTRRRR